MTVIEVNEVKRSYYYPTGKYVTIENAETVEVLKDDVHRITEGNVVHIIRPGWHYLKIENKEVHESTPEEESDDSEDSGKSE